MASRDAVSLERRPQMMWAVAAVVALTLVCTAVQTLLVQPYLWPAGDGIHFSGAPPIDTPLPARPVRPEVDLAATPVIDFVAPESPADRAGIKAGDRVLELRRNATDDSLDLRELAEIGTRERLDVWRQMYWLGVRVPLEWRTVGANGESQVLLDRPSAWSAGRANGWARLHLGDIFQSAVFAGAAVALLLLRSRDLTAWLSVLALALTAVSGGGPLRGEEAVVPGLGRILTVYAWMAAPLAFPIIALAILHFPSPSLLVVRRPWLQVVPFIAAAPMIVPSLATAIYLCGVTSVRGLAVWDATHPEVFYASAAGAMLLNLLVLIEGVFRYRWNHDANERRRIRMAVYTAVPGVLAYTLKDGASILASVTDTTAPAYPWPVLALLQLFVLLPAFGLVYAVGVARVLGPRTVLRRSLQYALASRTLTVLTLIPAAALVFSLLRDRELTIREVATGSSGVYIGLVAASVAAFRYRERARMWLDQRFFREEYDARKILLSLATRVRFETDPADLASTVVEQIDAALHPEAVAILVSGIEQGSVTPVSVLHGAVDPLPLDGGLASMLRWSEEPLEIYLRDPRSPARRLPAEEQDWLERSGIVLLVPVLGQDRALIAIIALAGRRSEEAYTDEDRQLLAGIAAQMALGFDVARLRRPLSPSSSDTTRVLAVDTALHECPRCGRCEDETVAVCPADGSRMQVVGSVPKVIENKYRLEQLLGRGGMGAVYRARDMRLDRLVAIKVVRSELLGDPDARARFRREAQIVAHLHHPSIVAIYDYGTLANGGAYLVMELVRGEDLRRVLLREGRLEPTRAAKILTNVCGAIEAAHREGVLHRDLKPENILLPGDDTDVKVLDFGVAKLIADERPPDESTELSSLDAATIRTTAGMFVGTPAYMAPEQLHAGAIDARTDVFSLGIVAYEMFSGRLPFGRGTVADVILAQSRGAPPLSSPDVSSATERAVRAALELDADRRPATPQAFAHLLNAAVAM
jgi:tRNA A-37 threonylcarbamoyl transferase component Bud32